MEPVSETNHNKKKDVSTKSDELAQKTRFLAQRKRLPSFGTCMNGLGLAVAISFLAGIATCADFVAIDFPGASATEANGMTPDGPLLIVGDYADATGEHAYLLSGGGFTSINAPGSIITQAYAVNTNGVVVGDYNTPAASGNNNIVVRGYVLKAGTFTTIVFPGAAFTTARGINSQGQIVGIFFTSSANANQFLPPGNTGHGFLLNGGTFSSIDFPGATLTEAWRINDAGQILGRYQSATDGNYHLFLLSNGVFTTVPDVPGSLETAPADISFGGLSGAGDIVGDYADQTPVMTNFRFGKANGNLHGFLLSGGVYTTIDFPGANATAAWGVNASGFVIGPYLDTNNIIHGYLRTP